MSRVGLGFDAHAFDAKRSLVLGGVSIPDSPGLAGHSDADVLTHAIADAVLGAAGLGDLGERFPSTPEWRDANSIDILKRCVGAARDAGWGVVNVDATVIAQAPPLAGFRDRFVATLSDALGLDPVAVSVKATSTDGLGFAGRGEGIAALAVALAEQI